MRKRVVFFLLVFFISPLTFHGQKPVANFQPDSLDAAGYAELKEQFGSNKRIPRQYEKQVLLALSFYPELAKTSITFRVRARHAIAVTRSTWPGIIRGATRRPYVITISDSTESMLRPLLFHHLSFNAQIGVIGHELAHIIQYSRKGTRELVMYAAGNLSVRYINRFEYTADSICVAHGLGYQLLEWSQHVRSAMKTENWMGPGYVHRPKKKERYMNPSTIKRHIALEPVYEGKQITVL